MLNKIKKNIFKYNILKNNLSLFNKIKFLLNKDTSSYNVFYNNMKNNLLSSLLIKYKSDKSINVNIQTKNNLHNYSDYYDDLFYHNRHNIKKVFECGVGSQSLSYDDAMEKEFNPGASLRAWRDYFVNADIYGADIDKKILFNENKIKTFYVDQENKDSILEMWKNINQSNFDLIIDDGKHQFDAGICLFENSIKNLSNNGIYIIEDIKIDNLLLYEKYFSQKYFSVKFISFGLPNSRSINNNIIAIKNL